MKKRNKFNLSHYRLISGDGGYLIPITHFEALPGDTIQHQPSVLLRASPLLAPVMHRFQVRLHTFFVPYRLLDDNWEDFITGQDTTPPQQIDLSTFDWGSGAGDIPVGSLADYLAIKPDDYSSAPDNTDVSVNAFPLLAYNLIYNEYYRDQDLITEVDPLDPDLKRIAWGKDYFTASRPWPQKGTAITLPLGNQAPIHISTDTSPSDIGILSQSGNPGRLQPLSGSRNEWEDTATSNNLYADLTTATAASVRDVRLAFGLQRYEEARAMYGSRYSEYLRYLGVTPGDARLQRPEYLGGGKRDISFSEVLQTAEGTDPVGTMRGHGISGLSARPYRKYIPEHGVIMTLLSVRPQSIYMDGMHRSWFKQTKEDYFQKELQFIGQQAVNKGEVYFAPDGENLEVMSYSDRYAEYRQHPSSVAGDFRTTLDFWHAARSFASRPALNQSFVECDPTGRIFSVPSEDTFWIATQHKIAARRIVSASTQARII